MSAKASLRPADVISFWREAGPEKWFAKDEAFDRAVTTRFGALHAQAADGGRDEWTRSAERALALLLLLDQFSRNIHRGTPRAFAQDEKAREIARNALRSGLDRQAEEPLRQFFYLPFMHSEKIADQETCVTLFHSLASPGGLPYARDHERIIRRFGRFPHRNAILGRHTTPAERAFLEGGGFSG